MQENDHDGLPQPPEPAGDTANPPAPRLVVDAVEAFNYAAWQNDVPLLRKVEVDNREGGDLSSLMIEISGSPGFVRPKRWTLDRIGAGTTVALRDIDVEIEPEYLDRLDESERGVLRFTLNRQVERLSEAKHELRVLARDEWGGLLSMGELLPAFVTPNDPAMAGLLKAAAAVLDQAGQSGSLDGYQSGDPNRAYLLAAALWSAVAAKGLTYANPPASFESVGQKVRRVGNVLGQGLATCLDSTLLFSAGLEAMGLNPVIVMTQGHCFAGVWLVPTSFSRLVEGDCGEVRKAVAAKELVVFETTLITSRPAAPFANAVTIATAGIATEKEHEFQCVIDIARGRQSRIRPIASRGEQVNGKETESTAESGPLPLPMSPGFERPMVEDEDERPQTPAGRIERWQRKLLDLSLRNRLLNFRESKQTVPVLAPDLSRLEDYLADGKKVRLISLHSGNPFGDRDAELHRKRTSKDLCQEFARRALERNELPCPAGEKELEGRLTTLYRKSRNDLAEGGSNTLYLAVGFLRWRPRGTEGTGYRAPLLLVPVQLVRRSASSPFYLASHEDEVRFNATLLQMLKKDFACDLTRFETELPTDDSGVDVRRILDRMRQAVREIPGFEVLEEAAIASFSFAKYLMWRDLVDRVGQLEHNRVVRHLIHDPDKPFTSDVATPAPRPHEVDVRYSPRDFVQPLPADSSQLSAVMAAAEGHDLVIVGPPGTGKSQTITNLIAQCLAMGKTVLFVAEKTAALDVVHRRLRQHGLGVCCVELHSNKAERRKLLDQLEASWRSRQTPNVTDWQDVNERLLRRRDQLNAYAVTLHATEANGWTIHRAMGETVCNRDVPTPRLDWPSSLRHDRAAYAELESTIASLVLAYQALNHGPSPLRVEATEWSMAWESSLLEACGVLSDASTTLEATVGLLFETLQLPVPSEVSTHRLGELYKLARELAPAELPPVELILHERIDALRSTLDERKDLLRTHADAKTKCEATFKELCRLLGMPDAANTDGAAFTKLLDELSREELAPAAMVFHAAIDRIQLVLAERPALLASRDSAREALLERGYSKALLDRVAIDAMEREWAAASNAFPPLSIWKKSAVKGKLKSFMTVGRTPDPDLDLRLFRDYREAATRLTESVAAIELPEPCLKALKSDPQSLEQPLHAAQRLRNTIVAAGLSPETVRQASGGNLQTIAETVRRSRDLRSKRDEAHHALAANLNEIDLSPDLVSTVVDDGGALDDLISKARGLREALAAVAAESGEQMGPAVQAAVGVSVNVRTRAVAAFVRAAKGFQSAWELYKQCAGRTAADADAPSVVAEAGAEARRVLARRAELKPLTVWERARRRAKDLRLDAFLDALVAGAIDRTNAVDRFRLAYARWWLPQAVDRHSPIREFHKDQHEEAIANFRELDDLARQAAAPRVRQETVHELPAIDEVPRKSELGVLRHQIGLKRPSRSIRDLIAGMPTTFSQLAPCLLMSPLSIAQYLPANHPPFDVVVFDEASQIATWDAIGAIARGRQTVIVGDPKQLPPTNFFGRADSDDDNPDLEDHEKDLESILDEAIASGILPLQLNWHYRSRHESLIAFSNWKYYGNTLVTFPAAESIDRGVSFKHVPNGLYDRGKSRTNRIEAEAVVTDAVWRMRRALKLPAPLRPTFGVVTFNMQQQELIQDLLDMACREHPTLEWFFSDERVEPTVVKNLENVQGDERDVMLFSIAFGFDAAGKFPIDFGAMNREGGERRLNVAVTRARRELVVFASFQPDQLQAERSSKRGVHDLKAFLEYADKGPAVLATRANGSEETNLSPLEQAVANALSARGWRLDRQVGVSGFRIDFGVVHPDKPGAYLAGIECDGATYNRAAAARDRDKIRQQVLEGLGWRIVRVWSTDWWYAPDAALDGLDRSLNELLQRDRATHLPEEEPVPAGMSFEPEVPPATDIEEFAEWEADPVESGDPAATDDVRGASEESRCELTEDALPEPLVAEQTQAGGERLYYRRAELADATANQNRFFEDDYADTLRSMARTIVEVQGPIREDAIAREIARAHGFARTGGRITQRVVDLLSGVTSTEESVGRFYWGDSGVQSTIPFRYSLGDDDRRSLDEIAMAELLGLVHQHPTLIANEDPAVALAREIGLARLARSSRDRIELALEVAQSDSIASGNGS